MKLNRKITSYLVLLCSTLIMSACDTNNTTSSVEGPNPDLFKPTGTLVGSLVDATTNEPIVGAVIDVGLKTATTNANGVFVMSDLAATSDGTTSSTVNGSYSAMVNFTGVTSPINMATTTGAAYPDHVGPMTFSVTYSSLEDSSLQGNGANDTVSANHDTPISGLVSDVNWTQGKLSTTVTGEIRDMETNALVNEAYTVQLFNGAVLLQEITTATGSESTFTFSGVQASTAHSITAFNSANSMRGTRTFTSPADNQQSTLTVGGTAQPLLVSETDAADPYIFDISVNDGTTTFENGADIGAAATGTVTFTFSEAMKADGYATGLTPTTGTELYDDVTVAVAAKAGNVAHSMIWNTTMTALSVSIPTLTPSAIYTLTIAAGNTLMDANDEPLDEANSTGHTAGTIVATFSTSAAAAVTAPTVAVINSASLDEGVFAAPILDWNWGAGAAYYNVYRTDSAAGVVNSAMQLVNATNLTTSTFTDAGGASNDPITTYKNGELALSYSYIVRAVNADGTESADSTAVVAADVNGPSNAPTAACAGGTTDVTVTFNEDVAETAAETVANYTLGGADAALTISNIVATTNTAVLTLSANCTPGATVTIDTAVTDLAGNALGATPADTAGTASAAIVY